MHQIKFLHFNKKRIIYKFRILHNLKNMKKKKIFHMIKYIRFFKVRSKKIKFRKLDKYFTKRSKNIQIFLLE